MTDRRAKDYASPAEVPLLSVFDEAWDLGTQHQVAQGILVHKRAAARYAESFRPSGDLLGEVDLASRTWFAEADPQEKRSRGILYAGILVDGRFYSAHHLKLEKDGTWTLTLFKSGTKVKERYIQESDWVRAGFANIGVRIHLVRLLHPDRSHRAGADLLAEDSITQELKHLRRSSADLEGRIVKNLARTPAIIELDPSRPEAVQALCGNAELCPFCAPVLAEIATRANRRPEAGLGDSKETSNGAGARNGAGPGAGNRPESAPALGARAGNGAGASNFAGAGTDPEAPSRGRAGFGRAEAQRIDAVIGEINGDIGVLFRAGGLPAKLRAEGIRDVADIDKASATLKRLLKPRHWIQAEAFKNRRPHVDNEQLRDWLSGLRWPLFFLDFESYSAAIPDFDGLAPWEHYPFAYSLCRADSWQELNWIHSYIAEPGRDGRPQIAAELVERLGTEGSILVYGIEFEHFVLARMRDALAEPAREIENILPRLRDLQHPFSEFAYYHPAQGSKISLKTILPILTSGLVHGDLSVQNGADASFGYYFLAHPDQVPPALAMDAQSRKDFLRALDEYSRLDTEGLFRIVQSLSKLVGLW